MRASHRSQARREFLPDLFRDPIFGTIFTETAETVAERVRRLMKKPPRD